jgi:hypothetical protein
VGDAGDASEPKPPAFLPSTIPHIYLDKAYLLKWKPVQTWVAIQTTRTSTPRSGSFQEALASTAAAKARYTKEDVYLRGSQLLATGYDQVVTAVRAFVEVGRFTKDDSLEMAIKLKHEFAHLVHVQICVFAQEPLSPTEYKVENLTALEHALGLYHHEVEIIGTTPCVEGTSVESTKFAAWRNIDWAVQTAQSWKNRLDFHMEHNHEIGQHLLTLQYVVMALKDYR